VENREGSPDGRASLKEYGQLEESVVKTQSYRLASVVAAGLTLLAGVGSVSAARHAKAPTWVTTKGKVVNLTVIAAYNNALSGFSFNGYGKGQLTITVPKGDTVNVTFSNAASLSHSVQFTVFNKTLPTGGVRDAFKGSHSANPANGVTKGVTQKFSFVASKAGKYMMICAVPGHAVAGMWDNFVVSATAKTASATVGKAGM
jgi:sulfocyanin